MSGDNNATSLKQLFQSMCPEGPGIVEGIVTSVNPLRVTLVNDTKMVLTTNSLAVPRHLTDYTVTADISGGSLSGSTASAGSHTHGGGAHLGHTEGDGSHSHMAGGGHMHKLSSFSLTGASVTVHEALHPGERVYLLSYKNGKQYYILDRKG